MANCPKNFSNRATYHSLVQNDVNHVKCTQGRGITAMTTSNNANIVNAPSISTSFMEPAPHPVAAVLGMSCNPIAYITPNASSVIKGHPSSDSNNDGSFVSDYITPTCSVPSQGGVTTTYPASVLVLLDKQQHQ